MAKKQHTRQSSAGKEVHAKEDEEDHEDPEANDEFEWSPSPGSEHESVENDILIDDEGISDIAKRNGIVINPSGVVSHFGMLKFCISIG